MDNVLQSFLVAINFDLNKSQFANADNALNKFSKSVVSRAQEANKALEGLSKKVKGNLEKAFDFNAEHTTEQFKSIQESISKVGQAVLGLSDVGGRGLEKFGSFAEKAKKKLEGLKSLREKLTPSTATNEPAKAKGGFTLVRRKADGSVLEDIAEEAAGAETFVTRLTGAVNGLKGSLGSIGAVAGGFTAGFSAMSSMAMRFIKIQGWIAAGFTAITAAVVGFAEHVANADLEYQLLGMRMMMSTEQARRVKIATDLLGASIEDIAFNPELRKRFEELQDLQKIAEKGFGGNYEANMRSIRDLMFDFKTLGMLVMKYLGPAVINKIFGAFGVTLEGFQEKVERFINYLAENIGPIADKIANNLVPVLRDAQGVFMDLWDAAKSAWGIFSDLIGVVANLMNKVDDGSKKIDTQASSLDQLFEVLRKGIHWTELLFHGIMQAERAFAHFVKAALSLVQGNLGDALSEAKAGLGDVNGVSGGVLGSTLGTGGGAVAGAWGGAQIGGALGTAVLPGVGTLIGGVAGGAIGGIAGGVAGGVGGGFWGSALGSLNPWRNKEQNGGGQVDLSKIVATANRYGIPPALLVSLAQSESGIRQYNSDGSLVKGQGTSATGVFQIINATAKHLGIDASDENQNIEGGARYLREQFERYDDWGKAVMAYHDGSFNGNPSADAIKEAQSTLGRLNTNAYAQMSAQYPQSSPQQNVQISVTNHVQTTSNASAKDIANAIDTRMTDRFRSETMQNMMRLQPAN